jgi:hypothetical protein
LKEIIISPDAETALHRWTGVWHDKNKCLFCVQSCFSPLDKDTVYLRQEGNANSDVEAVLNIDPDTHMGVRMAALHRPR